MRKKAAPLLIALSAGVLLGLLLFFWPLVGHSWVFCRGTDIDINSGDIRHAVHVFRLRVKGEIQESDLSREVRRLGIDIPATRVWKRTFESYLVEGRSIHWKYGQVDVASRQLLSILDETNAPDEERQAILEKFMASLRKENADHALWQARLLTDELAEKHGVHVFTPEIKRPQKSTPRGAIANTGSLMSLDIQVR